MSGRFRRLDELDLDNFDDQERMQSGSRNARACLPTRGGGTGERLKPFGGVADQCGTCHQVMWECPWQIRAHEIRDLPQAEQKAAWDALGLHPRPTRVGEWGGD